MAAVRAAATVVEVMAVVVAGSEPSAEATL
jgi:hypothetical protein